MENKEIHYLMLKYYGHPITYFSKYKVISEDSEYIYVDKISDSRIKDMSISIPKAELNTIMESHEGINFTLSYYYNPGIVNQAEEKLMIKALDIYEDYQEKIDSGLDKMRDHLTNLMITRKNK